MALHPIRRLSRRTIAAAIAAPWWSCGNRSVHQGVEIRLAFTAGAFGHRPLGIAHQLGYFQEEGLRMSLSPMTGSAKVMEALLGGSAEVAAAGPEHLIQLHTEGQRVKAFVQEFNGIPFALAISPAASRRIETVADLEGAVAGVTSPGSQTHLLLSYLLERKGLGRSRYSTVGIGAGAPAVAALEQGRVDCAVVTPGALEVLERRHPALRLLFDPRDVQSVEQTFGTSAYPSFCLCAKTDWLLANPGAARKIARAVVRSLGFVRHRSAAEILAATPQPFRSGPPEAEIAALDRWARHFSPAGAFPAAGFDAVVRVAAAHSERVRSAAIRADEIYTNEFVAPVEK